MSAPVGDLAEVIAAGRQSRAELAVHLAKAFQHDPARFDPRSLERLGAAGLHQFLGELSAPGAPMATGTAIASPPVPQRKPVTAAPASGWRHLRRTEWSVWLAGVVSGSRAGAAVAGAGIFFVGVAEMIAPLVKEVLS